MITTTTPPTATCHHCHKQFPYSKKRTPTGRNLKAPKYCTEECRHQGWLIAMKAYANKREIIPDTQIPTAKGRRKPDCKLAEYISKLVMDIRQAGSLKNYLTSKPSISSEQQRAILVYANTATASDHETIHRYLHRLSIKA